MYVNRYETGPPAVEILRDSVRRTQSKLQALSLLEQKRSTKEEKDAPLLEKMLTQRIHVDISTLSMDMMIQGVQAVVNCEAFLIYFLAKNPRAQKRLHDEVISVIHHLDRAPS